MDPDMELEKCIKCKFCSQYYNKNGDGKQITLYCINRFKECPNNN